MMDAMTNQCRLLTSHFLLSTTVDLQDTRSDWISLWPSCNKSPCLTQTQHEHTWTKWHLIMCSIAPVLMRFEVVVVGGGGCSSEGPLNSHNSLCIIPLSDCSYFLYAAPGVFLLNPGRCDELGTFSAASMRTLSMFPASCSRDNYLFNRRTLETGVQCRSWRPNKM